MHPLSDWKREKHVFNRQTEGYVYTIHTQPAITCSKLTVETLQQGMKYVQN